MLVDIHLNDPEQSTSLLLPFTDAILDHLSLFVSQMRVVARSVADPAMFVRRHGFIMHPWRQSDFAYPGVGPLLNVVYRRESRRWFGSFCEYLAMNVRAPTTNDAVECAHVSCGDDSCDAPTFVKPSGRHQLSPTEGFRHGDCIDTLFIRDDVIVWAQVLQRQPNGPDAVGWTTLTRV